MRIRPFDVLAALSMLLFVLVAWAFTFDRFVRARGRANLEEFVVYAIAISVGLVLGWIAFRGLDWDLSTLFLIGGGIVLHCAGCVPVGDGTRIYDLLVCGVRYDKIVHFFAAFFAVRVVIVIADFEGIDFGRLEGPAIVLIVLGVGTVWEIVEYGVMRTIPRNGVGLYDNNSLDLVANLLGSICSRLALLISPGRWRRPDGSPVAPGRTRS